MSFYNAILNMTSVRELMKQYGPFTDSEISKILEFSRLSDDKQGIILIIDCSSCLADDVEQFASEEGWNNDFINRVVNFFKRSEWDDANNYCLQHMDANVQNCYKIRI